MWRRLRPAPADPWFEPEPWRPATWVHVILTATLLGVFTGWAIVAIRPQGAVGEHRYSLVRWEAQNLAGSMFALAGIGPDPRDEVADNALNRYFGLTSRLRAELEQPDPDRALLTALSDERATYENDVERIVERYVSEAVTAAGLDERLPLFRDVSFTWPPVDFELTGPPQLLVRSPRDRIHRDGDTLLEPDLTLGDVEALEERISDENTSAIVVSVGGIAAWPAIVRDNRTYDSLLDTASHEWVHHYLAFYPLGQQWGKGGDAHALNETTANIAGRELARLIRQRHPKEFPDGQDGRAPPRPPSDIDFNAEMHSLRLAVDALLEAGEVEEAERMMEEKRQFFEENGIYIRKINQAYFAFYGTYADSPASSDPIGPKIEEIWEHTQDVGTFLKLMREVRDVEDLDETLARVQELVATAESEE